MSAVDEFFIWAIGKPVPVGLQIVMTVCVVAAIVHWSHLIKWCIEGLRDKDKAD